MSPSTQTGKAASFRYWCLGIRFPPRVQMLRLVLGTSAERRGGSSPSRGTKGVKHARHDISFICLDSNIGDVDCFYYQSRRCIICCLCGTFLVINRGKRHSIDIADYKILSLCGQIGKVTCFRNKGYVGSSPSRGTNYA